MKNLKFFFQTMIFFIVFIVLVEYLFAYGLQAPAKAGTLQILKSVLPTALVVFFLFFMREVYRR